MKRADFKEILKLAMSDADLPAYLSAELSQALGGIATDGKRRFATRAQVAGMVRGQCLTLGGYLDALELREMEKVSTLIDLIE